MKSEKEETYRKAAGPLYIIELYAHAIGIHELYSLWIGSCADIL
jgi:hypothetical protein